jgi:hypothetical protein
MGLSACRASRRPSGQWRAGKLRAWILGQLADIGSRADGDRAAPRAPGAACLAGTLRPGSVGDHVFDMLGSYHGYDLRMHCNLLKFGPCLTRHY